MAVGFAATFALAFPTLYYARKLKAGQTVLQYVDKHEGKSGTPTMGGISFLLGVTVAVLAFGREKLGIVALCVALGYGLVGFLDDFIKIKFKRNLGLKAYQKVIGQLGITIIVTVFLYLYSGAGSVLNIPFAGKQVDIGIWIIPLCMTVFIALTNSVNLTDGLDGLVAQTSSVYFTVFGIIIAFMTYDALDYGRTLYVKQIGSLGVFAFAFAGAMLAFCWFNTSPAKIFMGDTGSLAAGGAAACVAVFSKNTLFIPIVGIMYVVSCISVILQVLHYKRTKKRIFLMAPYHHHLEYKGIKECKIVSYYTIVTVVAGIVTLIAFAV